jgi:hypothetical protein
LSEHTKTTLTQQCYKQLDVSRQKYKEKQKIIIIIHNNNNNKRQQSGENERKIAREEDAWTIAT